MQLAKPQSFFGVACSENTLCLNLPIVRNLDQELQEWQKSLPFLKSTIPYPGQRTTLN
jgi:hypothetical protein